MSAPNKLPLPATFWWANLTQMGGALNDNLFKLFMIYALLDWNEGVISDANIMLMVSLVFAIPFLLILPIAGTFADRFSKRNIIVTMKVMEVGVMSFGVFSLSIGNSSLLYVTIALMSTQSAIFGPCKYGIIPEQVPVERLSRANGMLQMFTFLAIIAGTVIAPELSLLLEQAYHLAALSCLLVAGIGLAASLKIAPSPAHENRRINFNGFANLFVTAQQIRKDGFLMLAVLATSFFMFTAAFAQMNILLYGEEHLSLQPEQATRLFLLTAIGIGMGSVIAGMISGRSIEFGIVPVGSAMMFGAYFVLGTVGEGAYLTVAACMLVLGLGAGFFVVPLESFIQYRSPRDKVGSIKATSGWLSWVGILLAGVALKFNASVLGWNAQEGFFFQSFLLMGLTVLAMWILPDFFVKFVVMVLTRSIYSMRVFGLGNLPHGKPALLVCNHVSLMDAVLVITSQQRRIRMLMSRNYYNQSNGFVRWIVRLAGTILIQDSDSPKELIKSLKRAREALDEGFLVCIFAEGALTRSGEMQPFKAGFTRIVKGSEHAIIPVNIEGAWGSVSSHRKGKPHLWVVRDFRHPVRIHYGEAMPATSSVEELEAAVRDLPEAASC
jgi:acyl-[acyl-carrier-protein]-phospholipid O-acyltransferase/long-chain-fatty-acid--[acyl-carrier-protein] ligase